MDQAVPFLRLVSISNETFWVYPKLFEIDHLTLDLQNYYIFILLPAVI